MLQAANVCGSCDCQDMTFLSYQLATALTLTVMYLNVFQLSDPAGVEKEEKNWSWTRRHRVQDHTPDHNGLQTSSGSR